MYNFLINQLDKFSIPIGVSDIITDYHIKCKIKKAEREIELESSHIEYVFYCHNKFFIKNSSPKPLVSFDPETKTYCDIKHNFKNYFEYFFQSNNFLYYVDPGIKKFGYRDVRVNVYNNEFTLKNNFNFNIKNCDKIYELHGNENFLCIQINKNTIYIYNIVEESDLYLFNPKELKNIIAFYLINNCIYILSRSYSLIIYNIEENKIINVTKLNLNIGEYDQNVKMIIDDFIFICTSHKCVLLDINGDFIDQIINLIPFKLFSINNNKIYLNSNNKILIYCNLPKSFLNYDLESKSYTSSIVNKFMKKNKIHFSI